MILIFATPEEARELLGLSTRQTEILRPQTSGPCVHYDERSEHVADAYPCTYPYSDEHSDGVCPHLDNPEVICPVKDACYAMHDVARTREAYEAPPPTHGGWPSARGWTPTEEQVMREARTPTEAVSLYRAAYPESPRSDASIKSRYHSRIRRARRLGAPPAPVVDGAAGELADADVCAPDGGTIDDTTCDRPHRSLVGQQVRLLGPHDLAGSEGTIRNVCADQVLVALKGIPDCVWVSKQDALPLSIEEVREGSR